MSELSDSIRAFILSRFLPGEPAENLTPETPLLTGGIIDSLGVLDLVQFLEERFQIKVRPYDMSDENMGSLVALERFIEEKKKTPK